LVGRVTGEEEREKYVKLGAKQGKWRAEVFGVAVT